VQWTVESFLEMRDTSTAARYLRATDAAGWERFRETVVREFRGRFHDPVEQTWTAWIAVGTK
jgi:hypothetical protein